MLVRLLEQSLDMLGEHRTEPSACEFGSAIRRGFTWWIRHASSARQIGIRVRLGMRGNSACEFSSANRHPKNTKFQKYNRFLLISNFKHSIFNYTFLIIFHRIHIFLFQFSELSYFLSFSKSHHQKWLVFGLLKKKCYPFVHGLM